MAVIGRRERTVSDATAGKDVAAPAEIPVQATWQGRRSNRLDWERQDGRGQTGQTGARIVAQFRRQSNGSRLDDVNYPTTLGRERDGRGAKSASLLPSEASEDPFDRPCTSCEAANNSPASGRCILLFIAPALPWRSCTLVPVAHSATRIMEKDCGRDAPTP